MFSLVECNKCEWRHVQVSRKYAETSLHKSLIHYNRLSEQEQKAHYGFVAPTIHQYEKCSHCHSSYKEFRDVSTTSNKPTGWTLSCIINCQE